MATTYEIANRRRKAEAIVAAIRREGGTVKDALAMTDEDWENAAKLAKVNVPSETTRLVVIQMLRGW